MTAVSLTGATEGDSAWSALLRQYGGLPGTLAIFAVVHALCVFLGHGFKETTEQLTVMWPAAGSLLVALWLFPLRSWAAVLLIQGLVEWVAGNVVAGEIRPAWALGFIAANAIDGIVGALLLRQMALPLHSVHVYQWLRFLAAAAVGAAVSATLGAAVAAHVYGSAYAIEWQVWWAGNSLGSLIIGPLLFTWVMPIRQRFRTLRRYNAWEVPAYLAILAALTWYVFTPHEGGGTSLLKMPVILAAVLFVAAFRLPPRLAMLATTATVFLATWLGAQGNGPFGDAALLVRSLGLQTFLAALAVATYTITVFAAQMHIGMANLAQSEARYRSFIQLSSEAVWRVELAEPLPVALPVAAQREWLRRHAYVAECTGGFVALEGDAPSGSVRPWREGLGWRGLIEAHLEEAATKGYAMDGLRFTSPIGGKNHTFITSFCGVVIKGHLERIWCVARDVSEIVDLNTRLLREQSRLKGFARQLVTAEERARRATAVDLHDGIAQSLVGMAMTLEVIRDQAHPELRVLLDEMRTNLRMVQERTRSMIADLSPPGLYELGLGPALQWLAVYFRGKDKLQVRLDLRVREDKISMDLRVLIFKLVRELLRNVVKHAGVNDAGVIVRGDEDAVRVEVVDTGRGFEWQMDLFGPRVGGGFGLWSIADRINDVGGEFAVDTAPGRGARFALRFPLRRVLEDGRGSSGAVRGAG